MGKTVWKPSDTDSLYFGTASAASVQNLVKAMKMRLPTVTEMMANVEMPSIEAPLTILIGCEGSPKSEGWYGDGSDLRHLLRKDASKLPWDKKLFIDIYASEYLKKLGRAPNGGMILFSIGGEHPSQSVEEYDLRYLTLEVPPSNYSGWFAFCKPEHGKNTPFEDFRFERSITLHNGKVYAFSKSILVARPVHGTVTISSERLMA